MPIDSQFDGPRSWYLSNDLEFGRSPELNDENRSIFHLSAYLTTTVDLPFIANGKVSSRHTRRTWGYVLSVNYSSHHQTRVSVKSFISLMRGWKLSCSEIMARTELNPFPREHQADAQESSRSGPDNRPFNFPFITSKSRYLSYKDNCEQVCLTSIRCTFDPVLRKPCRQFKHLNSPISPLIILSWAAVLLVSPSLLGRSSALPSIAISDSHPERYSLSEDKDVHVGVVEAGRHVSDMPEINIPGKFVLCLFLWLYPWSVM